MTALLLLRKRRSGEPNQLRARSLCAVTPTRREDNEDESNRRADQLDLFCLEDWRPTRVTYLRVISAHGRDIAARRAVVVESAKSEKR